MKLTIKFDRRDIWVGAFWDREKRTLYVCPLPMLVFILRAEPAADAKRRAERTEVELHAASRWDCPECGIENFTRMIRPESIDREETISLLREKYGLSHDEAAAQEGEWMMQPDRVTCAACCMTFATTDPDAPEPGGDNYEPHRSDK